MPDPNTQAPCVEALLQTLREHLPGARQGRLLYESIAQSALWKNVDLIVELLEVRLRASEPGGAKERTQAAVQISETLSKAGYDVPYFEIRSAIAALSTPEPIAKGAVTEGGWTHVSTTPKAGGPYVIGGYVTGPLGRGFERTFGYLVITQDGPEWSHSDPAKAHIPIEYWFKLPCHPEHPDHRQSASQTPDAGEVAVDMVARLIAPEAWARREHFQSVIDGSYKDMPDHPEQAGMMLRSAMRRVDTVVAPSRELAREIIAALYAYPPATPEPSQLDKLREALKEIANPPTMNGWQELAIWMQRTATGALQ